MQTLSSNMILSATCRLKSVYLRFNLERHLLIISEELLRTLLAMQNLWVIWGQCNLKTKSQKVKWKKVMTLYKSFMLKAQTALVTGHFSNQVGFLGAVVPPPPQYEQGSAVQIIDLLYKKRICSMRKAHPQCK